MHTALIHFNPAQHCGSRAKICFILTSENLTVLYILSVLWKGQKPRLQSNIICGFSLVSTKTMEKHNEWKDSKWKRGAEKHKRKRGTYCYRVWIGRSRLLAQRDLQLDLQLGISAVTPVCEMSRKVRWSFLTLCHTGDREFLSVCQWVCLALLYFRFRGQPDRKHLAEIQEGWKIGSARVQSFVALLAKLSLLNCTRTAEMHSSGVTGWMQIGCDSPRAMIYWVIGATHEWRCSTTHSKSPILLFIPTAGLSPSPNSHSSPSVQSLSTISQCSSKSGYIRPCSLSFPSFDFKRAIIGRILFDFIHTVGSPEKDAE